MGRGLRSDVYKRQAEGWAAVLAEPGARLHLYGKAEIRQGRKMGHVNRIRPKAGG